MQKLLVHVPTDGQSYRHIDRSHIGEGYISVWKNIGYTPLQVLEEIQTVVDTPLVMTYVGRLDPMAEGWFDIVFNGDMDLKQRLMGKDKTYEIEVVFGIKTDTADILGKIISVEPVTIAESDISKVLPLCVGSFTWDYPAYSSPMLNRPSELPPKQKDIEIYSIDYIEHRLISAQDLVNDTLKKLDLSHMAGDFRLDEIRDGWDSEVGSVDRSFTVIRIKVHCSSGTYMRTLAEKIAEHVHTVAIASTIKRI